MLINYTLSHTFYFAYKTVDSFYIFPYLKMQRFSPLVRLLQAKRETLSTSFWDTWSHRKYLTILPYKNDQQIKALYILVRMPLLTVYLNAVFCHFHNPRNFAAIFHCFAYSTHRLSSVFTLLYHCTHLCLSQIVYSHLLCLKLGNFMSNVCYHNTGFYTLSPVFSGKSNTGPPLNVPKFERLSCFE